MNNIEITNLRVQQDILSCKIQKLNILLDKYETEYKQNKDKLITICPHPQNLVKNFGYGERFCSNCKQQITYNNR